MTEDVYCCHEPECTTEVTVPGGAVASCMDYCVVPEVKMLWALGIKTYCSCCGHGTFEKAYIRVDKKCADVMDALNYEEYEPHKCVFHGNSTKAYRAKFVKLMHDKGKPTDERDIEEIRELWRKEARNGGENIWFTK